MVRMLRDKALSRYHHRRQRAFHVCRPAAEQHAIADGGFKRGIDPAVRIASGHHVSMSGKGQRFALAAPGPEILGVAKIHTLHGKTDSAQALNH